MKDDTDGPTGRFDFNFVGTVEVPLNLDPAEFRGKTVAQISAEVLNTLRSINRDASFFEQDTELAAIAIYEANTNPQKFDIED